MERCDGATIDSGAFADEEGSTISAGEETLVVPAGGTVSAFRSDGTGDGLDVGEPPLPGAGPLVAALPALKHETGEMTDFQVDSRHDGFLNVDSPVPPLHQAWSSPVSTHTRPTRRCR